MLDSFDFIGDVVAYLLPRFLFAIGVVLLVLVLISAVIPRPELPTLPEPRSLHHQFLEQHHCVLAEVTGGEAQLYRCEVNGEAVYFTPVQVRETLAARSPS